MKTKTLIFSTLMIISISLITYLSCKKKINNNNLTTIEIKNSSKEDSVLVYVTLQSPNSVIGMFGIKDTIGSCSKGTLYAYKDSIYSYTPALPLLGGVISFGGDNLPCQVAIPKGFPTGINIFEFSINTPFEVFDISCEDGLNSVLKESVSDTINWSTGDSSFQQIFKSSTNAPLISHNLNTRGVFPYRCTDCIDLGTAIPENCLNLPDTCNTQRICQVERTNHNGGILKIEYISSSYQIANK